MTKEAAIPFLFSSIAPNVSKGKLVLVLQSSGKVTICELRIAIFIHFMSLRNFKGLTYYPPNISVNESNTSQLWG